MAGFVRGSRLVGLGILMIAFAGSIAFAHDGPACRHDEDWLWSARLRVVGVNPNDSSSALSNNPAASLEVRGDTTVDLSFRYMVAKHFGLDLTLLDSRHDVRGKGAIAALGKVAETRLLPPTLTLVYSILPDESTRPYVGIGLTRASFHGANTTATLDAAVGGNSAVSLRDDWGLALQLGCDFDIGHRWFLNLDAKYIWIDTRATITGAATLPVTCDIDVNPLLIGGGAGLKF